MSIPTEVVQRAYAAFGRRDNPGEVDLTDSTES